MNQARRITFLSGFLSAIAVAIFAFYGGWQRKWMSDDGLIVLRTVRNLLAGNGPVFNAGERVEANTSMLWQYIIYLGARIDGHRLETIAMWAALIFTTLAVFIATIGTTTLYRERPLWLLPFGGIIYLALPPARDFATSGLEWGLSLLWIAVLWFLLATWSTQANKTQGIAPTVTLYTLAFWCGISWLVRPELALYGGLVGLMLLIMHRAKWWKILLVAIPAPLAYQIFRMGYYGLLVPHTAVAKSATGAQWASGWNYIRDFNDPYWLIVALLIAAFAGALMVALSKQTAGGVDKRTPLAIGVILACATLHTLYVVRVGGDFMHGRMLLLPLFTLLLPVSVIGIARNRGAALLGAGIFGAGMIWSATAIIGGHPYQLPEEGEELGIVDERTFWQLATYRDAPTYFAEDFHTARSLRDYPEQLAIAQQRNDAHLVSYLKNPDPIVLSWMPVPRTTQTTGPNADLAQIPLSLTMINLGMTSMNAPLDVRVLDNMGLANPIAARQPRMPDARVGHDKNLPLFWQMADSGVAIDDMPDWVNKKDAQAARKALYTDEFRVLFESYRSPMSWDRFISNIKFSLTSGRTLQFEEDPEKYADAAVSVEKPQIYWPQEINTAGDRK
ncbi:MAG: flagellar motor control protein ZomB [Corynebacterium sp.]|uniref:flagellar motor control protein ZomB n=1 Tax=Corynebacterium sp. TaxID=1720 RepID=UPI0026DBFE53|nr:flagellar motor control protein ZomB [Corynebacterium sp.]MDO4761154.1 flagellar motor control protein ZomB [Corynebacterium sp.]